MRPVEARPRQQPDCAAVQPGMHAVAVELDLVQPLRPFRRRVDQPSELRLHPTGERRRFAPASGERPRHVLGTIPARTTFTCWMILVHRSTIGSTVSAFTGG